jgi:Mg2+ and Co2+ transporter CorA
MNLDHLPGKRDASTFGVVTLASIALSAGIFAVLRRARWL